MLKQFEKWNEETPINTNMRNTTEEQFKAHIEDEREAGWIAALEWVTHNITPESWDMTDVEDFIEEELGL